MAQGDPDEQLQAGSTSADTSTGAGNSAATPPVTAAHGGTEEGEGGAFEEDGALEEYEYEYEYEYADELGEPIETVDEQGRRHIRRAAPEGTEQILEAEAPRHTGLPDRAERWRMRSATGTVLTAFAFGLQSVFEPDRNQPAIIMETSGDPPRDLPVEAQLEQLGPRQSSVTVRPWLMANNLPGTASSEAVPDTNADASGMSASGTSGMSATTAGRSASSTTAGTGEGAADGSNGSEHPTTAPGEEEGR